MKTKDYHLAATLLRLYRIDMLAIHALRLTWETPQAVRYSAGRTVATQLAWGDQMCIPYSTTYEVLRQNRSIILNTK
jgi:hypothetical protein